LEIINCLTEKIKRIIQVNSREIKAELIIKGVSFTDIAAEAHCSVPQVSMCINGNGLYLKVREIVARKLGKKVKDVFTSNHPAPKRKTKQRHRAGT